MRRPCASLMVHTCPLLSSAGVYANKLALFGLAIEVFFEACNPLLHVLGCMRIVGLSHLAMYSTLSRLFLAQFLLFRWVAVHGRCGSSCLCGSAAERCWRRFAFAPRTLPAHTHVSPGCLVWGVRKGGWQMMLQLLKVLSCKKWPA